MDCVFGWIILDQLQLIFGIVVWHGRAITEPIAQWALKIDVPAALLLSSIAS